MGTKLMIGVLGGTDHGRTPVTRRSFAIHLGVLFIVAGVLVSRPALEATVFPAGTIGTIGTSRRAAVLLAFEISVVTLGVYLLAKRPRITVVHLTALALEASFATVVAAALLQ